MLRSSTLSKLLARPRRIPRYPIGRSFAAARRKRQLVGKIPDPTPVASFGKLDQAYAHGEDNMDEYLNKTSLSPWVPLPDFAARKIFDLTDAQPHDVHVDLGSGDGRINFFAIDVGRVKRSLGVDVDEKIVELARERRSKRHPVPEHLEFVVADLMDENHPVWSHKTMEDATIITMHFAEEALVKFRPLLERKLANRQHEIQIVTCGYEMPGWESTIQEIILGTQLNLYRWRGGVNGGEDLAVGEDILPDKPRHFMSNNDMFSREKMGDDSVIDRTGVYPIRGYNPDILKEDDDDIEDEWVPDDEELRADEKSRDGSKGHR